MVLINREPQVQQLQLAVIAIKQIATGSAILSGTSHILPKAVEGGTFLTVGFRVLAVSLPNVILEGLNPINLVGLLQRTRQHR